MKKRMLIGVIIAECNIDFQEELMKGIISQAYKGNCDIAVISPLHKFYTETLHKQMDKKIFELILSDRFDGFLYDRNIFYDDSIKELIDEYLVRSGKPVMLLDSEEHRYFESTAIDDCSAFEQITDHMIDFHGMKKIYCLTGPKKWFVSEERLKGFKNSLKKHGISGEGSCFYGDFWEEAANNMAAGIIDGSLGRPEAVVCGNDHSAITLITALRKGGIRVPEDIAVSGYDASEEGSTFTPLITSYKRPNFQLGAEAFRRIYRIITGRICSKVHHKNGDFRIGQSCGCTGEQKTPGDKLRRDIINKKHESDLLHRDMLFDITNTSDPEEFADRLDNYTYYIYKMKQLHICLTQKYINCKNGKFTDTLDFSHGDEMKVILSKSAIRREYSDIHFDSDDILPVFSKERSYPVAYYISPLHFNENFFGYAALSFGKIPMSFSEIYLYFINYINVALEQVRIRSILDTTVSNARHAMLSDDITGLPNRQGVKKIFSKCLDQLRQKSSKVDFIRIHLSGLNDAYYQSDDEKCAAITLEFAKVIKGCVKEDEILGKWSVYSFAVITPYPDRSSELFHEISEKVSSSQYDSESFNINFTVGVHSQPLYPAPSPGASLHKAAVNRVYSYTVSDISENPQYEKLCMLRGRLMKNPEFSWNINDIAADLFLSKSYLQKIYKSYFGKSIIEEMISFRLGKAKELLLNSDRTVTDISKECGYSSYNYFVRQFKMSEGVSPSEYRENNKSVTERVHIK